MYVHQHWPYNHPYAARTWTVDEWAGYADGLRQIGFNTIKIWPVLETMPDPLTKSDADHLEKLRQVIDVVHAKGMKVMIALCPNIVADDAVAGQMTFEKRHFFYCDVRVNPANEDAVDRMIRWREKLFRPLAKADGVAIIDSDPGGYPGSNNAEFIGLLAKHRQMFDRLRPGIELLYWIHAGWPGYCRFYETGEFAMSNEPEYLDALARLKQLNPEPWGLAGNIHYAKQAGLTDRAIEYRYGAIEGEPSFPSTNFGTERAYQAAQGTTGRGAMGNAQTHCLQLPNTFAFAQGAHGRPLTETSYVAFADRLIPGQGGVIVEGWAALRSGDRARMQAAADALQKLSETSIPTGPLKGLLFGDPKRFLTDIVLQLQLEIAGDEFCDAVEAKGDLRKPFCRFVADFSRWQKRHGYVGRVAWGNWPRLNAALGELESTEINSVLHPRIQATAPFARVKEEYYIAETATGRLTAAMESVAGKLHAGAKRDAR